MPNCVNGHDDQWQLRCSVCGGEIDYKTACQDLNKFPPQQTDIEKKAYLFIGFPATSLKDSLICTLEAEDEENASLTALTLKRINGGTWLDYQSKYHYKYDSWLRFVAYNRPRYKIVVIDTRNPLSVLAINSDQIGENSIVIAITADAESSPLEKNTSYVALTSIHKKNLPVILVENSYMKKVACFQEDAGLMMGISAFQLLLQALSEMLPTIFDYLERDRQLGVPVHIISSLMSASNQVYKSVGAIFEVQKYQSSAKFLPSSINTACLLAWGQREALETLKDGFTTHVKGLDSLITSMEVFKEKRTRYGFFDVLILYGLKDDTVMPELKSGYETVIKKIPQLKVESLK